MLQLKNIVKNYAEGDNTVRALRGVSLDFRKSDFVSILGPSGCGKTTMLNIIGGLDHYTEGDLIINGVSTKDYKDRDWDTYRNHSVGFVFQSYHLIPHQSVLQNVELALTLSGVSRKERRRRAKEALEAVGLGDQLRKRPGEMSGGQMQRVAIARALVNNPDIILADEPTGALDTETSVQVMDLLKEIAKDRLVIMVTHNPDLAERYSTRIIKMLDGQIISDSAPLNEEDYAQLSTGKTEQPDSRKSKKARKPSMSLWTAFGLSLKNLFTKKGRTTLTAFAGSIGIIGIALIWAVSQGMHMYINLVQEETLASYPLTLEATTVDLSTLMETFMGSENKTGGEHPRDAIYARPGLYEMVQSLNNIDATQNDLGAFKAFLDQEVADKNTELHKAVNGVQYTYDLDLQVYTESVDGKILYSNLEDALTGALLRNMGMDMSAMINMGDTMGGAMGAMASMTTPKMNLWNEMLPGTDGSLINPLIKEQYQLVEGAWPNEYDEIVLVVDQNQELSDLVLYALGLTPQEEIDNLFKAVLGGNEQVERGQSWSYEEIMSRPYRIVLNSQCYTYDENTGMYTDLRSTETGLQYLYDNALSLKVTGIIRLKDDVSTGLLNGAIAYTRELTEYVVTSMGESAAIQAQKENPEVDIFTGLPFKPEEGAITAEEKAARFREYVGQLDNRTKASTYMALLAIPSPEQVEAATQQTLASMSREEQNAMLIQAMMAYQTGMGESEIETYVTNMDDASVAQYFGRIMEQQLRAQMAEQVRQQMAAMSTDEMAMAFEAALPTFADADCARYYDELVVFSESTYELNLRDLGAVDLEQPASINIYATSFENKDVIVKAIADYNESVDELKKIQYTDYLGLIMSSVTDIIDAITYVLIAFVAISLVVSSIMIGVITLISVQERTKEIGILRAIGASKRNVSSMFNAETVMIGFASGALGVILTYLLCIPINLIIQTATGIPELGAYLPPHVALILIAVSVGLTLISGIIPSRSAAKKDPVVALRTE